MVARVLMGVGYFKHIGCCDRQGRLNSTFVFSGTIIHFLVKLRANSANSANRANPQGDDFFRNLIKSQFLTIFSVQNLIIVLENIVVIRSTKMIQHELHCIHHIHDPFIAMSLTISEYSCKAVS